MNPKAIICAAGKGTRLRKNIPKALVEVCDEKIINRQLKSLSKFDITVIAGYQKALVAETLGDSVAIVENDAFDTTNVSYSISLCPYDEMCLILDGDLLIADLGYLAETDYPFVGVRTPSSEFPVYAVVKGGMVIDFSYHETDHEWACIFRHNPRIFDECVDEYVFEILKRHLPLRAEKINAHEIDTPSDLENADAWIKKQ